MGIILDLSAYTEETADIRLQDGNVLHLKKPTEGMVIHLLGMRDVDENAAPEVILGTLNKICYEILNCNADGVKFPFEQVAQMETVKKTEIIQAYTDWAVELKSNPTTGSRPSPDSEPKTRTRRSPFRFMRSRSTRG